jgi:Concanavalin A-like lectin/glucanases superfamily/PASTA domain
MACDPNFSQVALLLHMDGTNGQTTFVDSSSFANAISNFGSPPVTIDTSQPKFGTGAANFGATFENNALTATIAPDGPLDLNYKVADFTIEGWFLIHTGASVAGAIMADTASPDAGISRWSIFLVSPTELQFLYGSASVVGPSSVTVTTGQYFHFAVVSHNQIVTVYVNGVGGTPGNLSSDIPAATMGSLSIGTGTGNDSIGGEMDEIRISNFARYTSNFTPPTSAFGGSCTITVPNVVGEVLATAESAITAASLTVGAITPAFSSTVTAGSVVSQSPAAGAIAMSGDPVALVDSLGPAPVMVMRSPPGGSTGTVPTVTGRTLPGRAVEGLPMREAQSCLGPKFANSTYKFFLSGTTTPANVYVDGFLTIPFPIMGVVSSNQFGRFPPIYLDPSVTYRVQFFNSANVQQWQQDPYIAPLSTVGTSALSAFGFSIAQTGEVTLDAPNTGGSGTTLTLNAGGVGSAALNLMGTIPGASALIVNTSATTGTQTATFAATNKPGTTSSAPVGWLPITCDGVQYYTPLWFDNSDFTPYVVRPGFISIRNAGSSGVETVPAGASFVHIAVVGAGGGGSAGSVGGGGGGGGGGGAFSVGVAVSGGETFNYSVAQGGTGGALAGSTPANTTVTGNGPLSAISLTGSGGGGGSASAGGAGGAASGGNTQNTAGVNGSFGGVNGGAGGASSGGVGMGSGDVNTGGTPPGGAGNVPGGGGAGAGAGSVGGSGGGGIITFVYS